MIRIETPVWHDDGIVECYAILMNCTNNIGGYRVHRARLLEVRDALFEACLHYPEHQSPDDDDEQYRVLYDALMLVAEALLGRGPFVSRLRFAMRRLETLRNAIPVYQA